MAADNVIDWEKHAKPRPEPVKEFDGGGGGGDNGGMEARIQALEAANLDTRDRLIKIETRMDALASKEDVAAVRTDLHSSLNAQTWRIIAAAAALVTAVYFVATHAK